jgi:hypothetical protein
MVCRIETLRALHSGYVLEDPARIGIEYTIGQLCMYMQWIPVEIQTAAHWHIINSSTTTPQVVSSPRSILPPFLCHCVFNPAQVFQKYYIALPLHFKKLRKPDVS